VAHGGVQSSARSGREARIDWADGSCARLRGLAGWTLDGRHITVAEAIDAAPQLQAFVVDRSERALLEAIADEPDRIALERLARELFDAQRLLARRAREREDAARPAASSGLLRLSVTADGAGLPEADLARRMGEIFPNGVEETHDERGRFEVAAYESPPLTLPASLGAWRVEAVSPTRTRAWHERHHGVEIAGRLWVGPPDEAPDPGLIAVRIDPRQAFGAGAHATTTGCLELLCSLEEHGSVLDLGCGSGVLAIAAAALGHAPVMGCDNDPLSVAAARHNARLNDVDVEFFEADAAIAPLPRADLWLANLITGTLSDVLARADAPRRVIVSGVETHQVLDAPAYAVERRVERAGWQAVLLHRR
jgi:ribosomal protein L11 methyltransferase